MWFGVPAVAGFVWVVGFGGPTESAEPVAVELALSPEPEASDAEEDTTLAGDDADSDSPAANETLAAAKPQRKYGQLIRNADELAAAEETAAEQAAVQQAREAQTTAEASAGSARTALPSAEELKVLRRQVEVTLYAKSWCPACQKARAYLSQAGISFREHDVENSPGAERRWRSLNPKKTVPVLEFDTLVLNGYSPAGIERTLTQAALKRYQR